MINLVVLRIKSYQQLPQAEAVRRLIKAEKIEAKIKTIKATLQWVLED